MKKVRTAAKKRASNAAVVKAKEFVAVYTTLVKGGIEVDNALEVAGRITEIGGCGHGH